MAKSS